MSDQKIIVGKLIGVSICGDKNYYDVLIEGNIEKMESLSSSMDTFWYYLMHKGENVYKVPCVRCEKPLLVFLRPDPSIGFVPKCCSPIATQIKFKFPQVMPVGIAVL